MRVVNRILSSLILSLPFIAGSCGGQKDVYGPNPYANDNTDAIDEPISVYGPSTYCNAETNCVEIGEAWLAKDADKWVCNMEDGASSGLCGNPNSDDGDTDSDSDN